MYRLVLLEDAMGWGRQMVSKSAWRMVDFCHLVSSLLSVILYINHDNWHFFPLYSYDSSTNLWKPSHLDSVPTTALYGSLTNVIVLITKYIQYGGLSLGTLISELMTVFSNPSPNWRNHCIEMIHLWICPPTSLSAHLCLFGILHHVCLLVT